MLQSAESGYVKPSHIKQAHHVAHCAGQHAAINLHVVLSGKEDIPSPLAAWKGCAQRAIDALLNLIGVKIFAKRVDAAPPLVRCQMF
jgi:hypothetical protein